MWLSLLSLSACSQSTWRRTLIKKLDKFVSCSPPTLHQGYLERVKCFDETVAQSIRIISWLSKKRLPTANWNRCRTWFTKSGRTRSSLARSQIFYVDRINLLRYRLLNQTVNTLINISINGTDTLSVKVWKYSKDRVNYRDDMHELVSVYLYF